ncbi:GNAT family N-acetyltransferase [Streptomyces griseoloalbus]|uniref:GNAT superfamily N-acetyltransferase n=1 Tax=Streptomyces griseoloalbus TaxID=67303 RepID=A0A7W8BNF0_9ACTN|nr:GNAT family N-acetyltransferase [Streptomyces albaduncus]MBB5125606.1 GNAT superfamily N-acetyltransferase [Streptomyces albaduncus]GGW56562.1 N-acetyltransferase [Streptomyces albaduncus]
MTAATARHPRSGISSRRVLAPLGRAEAVAWWRERSGAVAAGRLAVWAAYEEPGRVLGTVSLALPDKPNSVHRAELVKPMVHRAARGRGLGRRPPAVAEEAAAARGVTLLRLDTETGRPAERLHRSSGWVPVGAIPDYAADPAGVLRPTTIHYKRLGTGAISPATR